MKILITGALGHIGSKLISILSNGEQNHELVLIDNLSTQRYCSLFNLQDYNSKFIESDLLKNDVTEYLNKVDVVIHLAALTDAAKSLDSNENVEQTNFETSKIITDLCSYHKIPLIFISSTSIYKGIDVTLDENCGSEFIEGSTPYAKSKLSSEKYILQKCKNHNLKATILRFGTIVGPSPGMRFHTAVNKFIWDIYTKQKVSVWRTAIDQKRPYLSLTDGTRAISYIIKENLFENEIYNVVSSNYTVREVLNVVRNYSPIFDTVLIDSPAMNNLSFSVDSEKLLNTGFSYASSLEDEIKGTCNLFFKS